MGLKDKVILTGGVEVDGSYLKVGAIDFDELASAVKFQLLAYKNKAERDKDMANTMSISLGGTIPFDDAYYVSDIEPLINSLKDKVYIWAKSNKFLNATDLAD